MPVGPRNINNIRHDLMKWVYAEIDEKIVDPKVGTQCLRGDSDDYYYQIFIACHFTRQEMLEVINVYGINGAGWPKVKVVNGQNNFSKVMLFSKEDSRFLKE